MVQREALVRMEVYFPNFCTFIFRKKVKDFINFFMSHLFLGVRAFLLFLSNNCVNPTVEIWPRSLPKQSRLGGLPPCANL